MDIGKDQEIISISDSFFYQICLYLRLGIIAGIILLAVIVYTVIALNRQKNKAEAERDKKNFRKEVGGNSRESDIRGDSRKEEDFSDPKE